jgi:hypothetical protein
MEGKPLRETPGVADELRVRIVESPVIMSVRKSSDAASLLETTKYDTL